MAKRNANDRNARAVAERKSKSIENFFDTSDGRRIMLKKPDLMFIQQTIHDVKMPEAPTYEVKIGNRTTHYPLDAEVIKQTEDPLEKAALRKKWLDYQQELNDATLDQAMRSTGAVFFEGTIPSPEIVEDDARWRKKVKLAGWKIPDDPEELWVFYLQTSLSEPDTIALSSKIVRMAGGVSEEQIQAAQDMFFDNLPAQSEGLIDLEDAEAD